LHGHDLQDPETLARIDALNEQYQDILKALTEGRINPEDEFLPLVPSVIPVDYR